MKKILLLTLAIAFISISAFSQLASTTPQNKKVILEEFTGIHCVFCPQGHAIAQALKDANPDDIFLINIHVGSYAVPSAGQPDFRTPFGTAIANQSGLAGYPAGTVNRHYYPGTSQGDEGSTAQNRGDWTNTANQTLQVASYVNVGVESEIDVLTNEITVHVQAYYTANSPETTNVVNIALLQDNTKGPQTGGGAGNNYNHNHRLVHLITGQWGETIPTTTAGTTYDQTFTYTIPADYNGVPTEITDMKIVAFVTENHQEVMSGAESLPAFSNLNFTNNASVNEVLSIDKTCASSIVPKVNIKNLGTAEITALTINYQLNSDAMQTYNWTGSIQSLRQETIELPEFNVDLVANNTITVSIQDDEDNSNNSATTTFEKAGVAIDNTIKIQVQTNGQGSQTTWYMRNGNGTIFAAGSGYGNNQTYNEEYQYDADCYTIEVNDSGQNGGGTITVSDSADANLVTISGNFGAQKSEAFEVVTILDTNDAIFENVSVYPNPVSKIINIKNAENFTVTLFDVLGKQVFTKNNIEVTEQINTSNFNNGVYFLRLSSDSNTKTLRIVINK